MYIITKWTLEYQNQDNPEEGIQMKIILKRRIINELLTSYLPSVLLILISYSTTFFRPCYFEASVTDIIFVGTGGTGGRVKFLLIA